MLLDGLARNMTIPVLLNGINARVDGYFGAAFQGLQERDLASSGRRTEVQSTKRYTEPIQVLSLMAGFVFTAAMMVKISSLYRMGLLATGLLL